MGQAPLLAPGLAQEVVPEEAALMPQDQLSQQPSLQLPTVHQAMAADTDEFKSFLREGYTITQCSPDA